MNTIAQTAPKSQAPLCKVLYDRSAKTYNVRNGKLIGSFADKIEAQWAAIDHDNPAVGRIARRLLADGVADEGRTIRAARLVIEGKITDHVHDGDYTRAQIEAGDGNRSPVTGLAQYQVVHNLKWSCDCYDYEANAAAGSQHKCKHILAVMIHQALEADRAEFQAAAARKQADRIERSRSLAPFSDVPGDGGRTLADIDNAPIEAEYMREVAREMARRERVAREQALPATSAGSIEDMLGYDDRPASRHHSQEWRTAQPTVGEQIEAARASLGGALAPSGPTIRPNWNGRNW